MQNQADPAMLKALQRRRGNLTIAALIESEQGTAAKKKETTREGRGRPRTQTTDKSGKTDGTTASRSSTFPTST